MEQINNVLFWLSNGMLVPVIVFLLFFFAKSLLMVGTFYGSYISRGKINVKLNKYIETMTVDEFLKTATQDEGMKGLLTYTLTRIRDNKENLPMLDKIMGDYEILSDKSLNASKLLVKIGPMLGLMGTLIPMGPALVGLATGDIASMATNMQVAFATTVVGIVIGAVGFITQSIKQRWIADDMNILEYVCESIKQSRHE